MIRSNGSCPPRRCTPPDLRNVISFMPIFAKCSRATFSFSFFRQAVDFFRTWLLIVPDSSMPLVS